MFPWRIHMIVYLFIGGLFAFTLDLCHLPQRVVGKQFYHMLFSNKSHENLQDREMHTLCLIYNYLQSINQALAQIAMHTLSNSVTSLFVLMYANRASACHPEYLANKLTTPPSPCAR